MKRCLLLLAPAGALLVAGLFLLRTEPRSGESRRVRTEDIRVPIQFRQNQPRHWRYVILSQGR